MKKAKSGLLLELAFAGSAMAACGGSAVKQESADAHQGSSAKLESTDADTPSAALSEASVRQVLEKSLLENERYDVVNFRDAAPLVHPGGPLYGHQDCFSVQIGSNGHLYEKCINIYLADETMLPLPEKDLGVRVATLAEPKP